MQRTGFIVYRNLYRNAKNLVTTLVQMAKSLFYKTKITDFVPFFWPEGSPRAAD